MQERHLGLVTQEEHPLTAERSDRLAVLVEEHLALDKLLANLVLSRASSAGAEIAMMESSTELQARDKGMRFGVARDEAFCFYYPDNLELLEQAGAELVFFSPLHDACLPENLRGIYLGGGYPEVH